MAQEQHGEGITVLTQTAVLIPFTGVVTKWRLDVGAYANSGTSTITVESVHDLELSLSVREIDVAARLWERLAARRAEGQYPKSRLESAPTPEGFSNYNRDRNGRG